MQQILPEFAQNCQNLLKSAQRQNFEIPPKIEIIVFLQKKNSACRGGARACFHYLNFSIQEIFIFYLYCQKTAFVCEFQHTPLWKLMIFSRFHSLCGDGILWICT
jgi:hypothetical protein